MLFRTLFILVLLWSTPCLALDITFIESSSVNKDTVLLSDVTNVSEETPLSKALQSQIVGTSPDPGLVSVLDAREIIKKIEKSHNSKLSGVFWKGSPLISVTRESVTITSEKIQEIIDDYITENSHRLPDAEISFIPDSLPLPFEIQTGSLSWDIIPSSPGVISSSRFSIIFKVDNKVRKNFSVKGHTKAITSVVTATRRLRYGDIITAEMVTIGDRDISTLKSYSRSASEVIGSVVKRNIQEGSIIGPEHTELPPVIKKGELVRIVVNHSGLVLTATGIAKSDGHIDEVIRVKNTDSNKLIYCRVQAPGLVEVRL
jgi:flagella basal body P-ring formation protein FlgA